MVATITFKLRSSNHVGVIDVPQRVISCKEVKEAISLKLGGSTEEIDIFVSGSSDLLHPEEELPAYTVVDVVRHVSSGRAPPKRERDAVTAAPSSRPRVTSTVSTQNSNEPASLTEEERLAQLNEAVAAETGIDEVGGWRMRQMRARRTGGSTDNRDDLFRPPPPGYICHNCGKKGHLIQHCPTAKGSKGAKMLSLPTGIPETMLVECSMDDPAAKFVTRDGRLVKRRLDNTSFTGVVSVAADAPVVTRECVGATCETVDENDDGRPVENSAGGTLPSKYLCAWDKALAKNAMKTPCCASFVCETCFNSKVEEMVGRDDVGEDKVLLCPGCEKPLCVPDVIAAVEERKLIEAFLYK